MNVFAEERQEKKKCLFWKLTQTAPKATQSYVHVYTHFIYINLPPPISLFFKMGHQTDDLSHVGLSSDKSLSEPSIW